MLVSGITGLHIALVTVPVISTKDTKQCYDIHLVFSSVYIFGLAFLNDMCTCVQRPALHTSSLQTQLSNVFCILF